MSLVKTYGKLALESMLVSVDGMKCFISAAPFMFADEHFWFIDD